MFSEVHDIANVTGSDSEDSRSRVGGGGQKRGPMHKRCKDGGRRGGRVGWDSERQKWREREGENKRCQFADERLGSQKAI